MELISNTWFFVLHSKLIPLLQIVLPLSPFLSGLVFFLYFWALQHLLKRKYKCSSFGECTKTDAGGRKKHEVVQQNHLETSMECILCFDSIFISWMHTAHTHTNTLILLFNRFNHKICNSWNQFNKPESGISFVYWNSLCHTDLFFLSFKLNWIKHRTCERFIVLLILFRLFWMKCHFLQHVFKFVDGNIHAYICVYEFFFSHTYYPLCSLIFTESLEWYNHIPVRLFFCVVESSFDDMSLMHVFALN